MSTYTHYMPIYSSVYVKHHYLDWHPLKPYWNINVKIEHTLYCEQMDTWPILCVSWLYTITYVLSCMFCFKCLNFEHISYCHQMDTWPILCVSWLYTITCILSCVLCFKCLIVEHILYCEQMDTWPILCVSSLNTIACASQLYVLR